MLRELTTADGAFAASQDADTDGDEGPTFTWRATEIREVLGDDAPLFATAYGVTDDGNWEGVTILSRVRDDAALADAYGLTAAEVAERSGRLAPRCSARRPSAPSRPATTRRSPPGTGWRSRRFAEAGRAFGEPATSAAAVRAAEAIVGGLLGRGRRRSVGRGRTAGRRGSGVLEDYADLADGLLALYEATFDERWFTTAGRRWRTGSWSGSPTRPAASSTPPTTTSGSSPGPKDVQDNAVPSGNAMAATVLLRLAALTGEGRYRDAAERAMLTVDPFVGRYPTGFAQWLSAMDLVAGAGRSRSRSSATRRTRRPGRCWPPA